MCIMSEFSREGDGSVPPQESQPQKKDMLYRLTSGVLGKGVKKPKPKDRSAGQSVSFEGEGAGAVVAPFTPVEGPDTATCDVAVVGVLSSESSTDLYISDRERHEPNPSTATLPLEMGNESSVSQSDTMRATLSRMCFCFSFIDNFIR